jgi:hypothetical protein
VTVLLYMYLLVCTTVLARVRDCTCSCVGLYLIVCATVLMYMYLVVCVTVLRRVRDCTRGYLVLPDPYVLLDSNDLGRPT